MICSKVYLFISGLSTGGADIGGLFGKVVCELFFFIYYDPLYIVNRDIKKEASEDAISFEAP